VQSKQSNNPLTVWKNVKESFKDYHGKGEEDKISTLKFGQMSYLINLLPK